MTPEEMPKWYNPSTDIYGTYTDHMAALERDRQLLAERKARGCTCHSFMVICNPCRQVTGMELQPARGWAEYDAQFLKDLGIEPLDPQ